MSDARQAWPSADATRSNQPADHLRRIPLAALLQEIDRQRGNYGPRNPAALLLGDCKLALLDLSRRLLERERQIGAWLTGPSPDRLAPLRAALTDYDGQIDRTDLSNTEWIKAESDLVDAVRALCQPQADEPSRARARPQLTITPVPDDEP
jgi:hypothetical protein